MIKRKIYGIGKIKKIGFDCKFLNYENADNPKYISNKEYEKANPLLKNGSKNNRCFCVFEPSPYYFENGVDMDDALNSNPSAFKMLRAMWKVSFIKIDDEENRALIDIILKRNEYNLNSGENVFDFDNSVHTDIASKVTNKHKLTACNILFSASQNNLIKHEMAIEAALCELLCNENKFPFGKWNYISHQVIASPFKAIDYMDKMDIFGYKYINGFSTISKYMVIEIKKDIATSVVIEQIMKYIDWIQTEYAHGDYSMIEGYIVAADFPEEIIAKKDKECLRFFTKGYRPSEACIWNAIKLIRYEYNQENKKIDFIEVKK